MTLDELLKLEKLEAIELVAGASGTNVKVTGTVMLDNPEMVDWMRKGELLLTTGYVLKENPYKQEDILTALIKKSASGLAIKTHRYFDEIPADILQIAEEHHFPILQIPYYLSLSEVTEIINKAIYLSDYKESTPTDISQSLFELLQRSDDIKSILDQSESFLGAGLIFLDLNMKLKHGSVKFSNYPSLPHETGENFFAEKTIDEYTELISRYGSISVKDERLKETEEILLHPVTIAGELLGYLGCIVTEQTAKLPDLKSFCSKITLALAFTLLKNRTYMVSKAREVENLLNALLTDSEMSHSALIVSANYFNMTIDMPYICCLLSFPHQQELNETNDWVGLKTLGRKALVSGWEALAHGTCRVVTRNNNVVLILSQNSTLTPYEQVNMAADYCRSIKEKFIDPYYSDTCFIGIGEPCASLSTLYRSYSQALRVVDLMPKLKEESIGTYRRYILYELLNDSPFAKLALIERLQPLLNYDLEHRTNLVQTLEAYFHNCKNSINTAKELYIHRNTLLYRLDQISNILDLDFSNNEQLLIFQLALKALQMQ